MSQITILNQANVPMGPFTREQVLEKLQRGEVTMSSLAFVEGLSQWTPLRDVLARMAPAAPAVPASAPTVSTPAPGTPAPAPATPTPAYSYAATMEPPSHLVYAGFWLRFVAWLIDALIIGAVEGIIAVIFGVVVGVFGGLSAMFHGGHSPDDSGVGVGVALLIVVVEIVAAVLFVGIAWLYFAMLESGSSQATIGKRVMGLQVTDMAGQRISFARATGRFFSKMISRMILYIGFIMAGFTERKQALHDMIAGTLVVRN